MIHGGNRKLLRRMRGKQCDMRQVGEGVDGRMDGGGKDEGAEAAVNTLSLQGERDRSR